MNAGTLFVFVLVVIASILFASGRVRLDIVALLVLPALTLGGVLSEREALSGFGSPVVLIVAGLLVVGEMLTRTRIAFAATSLLDLALEYDLFSRFHRFRVPADSPLVGQTLRQAAPGNYLVRVVVRERTGRFGTITTVSPAPDLTLSAGDSILVHGDTSDAKRFEDEFGLERLTVTDRERARWAREVGGARSSSTPSPGSSARRCTRCSFARGSDSRSRRSDAADMCPPSSSTRSSMWLTPCWSWGRGSASAVCARACTTSSS